MSPSSLSSRSDRPGPAHLVDLLERRVEAHPDRRALTFLVDGSTQAVSLTYRELRQKALALAERLLAADGRGERAALFCPPGLDYLAAFFGCQYAGVTAVPLFPPLRSRKLERLDAILRDAGLRFGITTSAVQESERWLTDRNGPFDALTWIVADKVEPATGAIEPHAMPPADLAFLQYTSGSTSAPRGVMVSQQNILSNLRYFEEWQALEENDCVVEWLPLFHDMGLVSALYALNRGAHLVLLSPLHVVQRPLLWLEAITRYRASFSGGPNFLYDLCCRKIGAEQRRQLDLSCWRVAFTGAEPVRSSTLERFTELFGECGFRRGTFLPCYGLAEFTLGVTGCPVGREPIVRRVRRTELGAGRFLAAGPDTRESDTLTLVSCGQTATGHELRIVDPESRLPRSEGQVGEIWARGPSMAGGYWKCPEASEERFGGYLITGEGPFLRTGDLGVIENGELYVVGRIKDIIIINGANHYPQDIELTVEGSHPMLAANGSVAFSMDEGAGEKLVILAEVASGEAARQSDAVIRAMREAVARNHDLALSAVVLLKPGRLPRTTSGKVRRREGHNQYRNGTLQGIVAQSLSPKLPSPPTGGRGVGGEGENAHGKRTRSPQPLSPEGRGAYGTGTPWRVEAPRPESPGNPSVVPAARPEPKQPERTRAEIQAWLVARLANELSVAASAIDPREEFTAFELDSLKAVSLSADLGDWLGRKLSPTLAWDYPTIERLARYLGNEPEEVRAVAPEAVVEPLALIGMGCRFAGADNLEAYLRLLRFEGEGIVEVPNERWNGKELYDPDPMVPGKTTTRWGGFLKNVDQFDPAFFGITPREARSMDPQQRLLLEVAYEAFEHAGLASDRVHGSRTGVYIGIGGTDYMTLQCQMENHLERIEAYTGTGNAHSVAANRLSYFFDLKGPSLAVDTACSSGLLALHLACQAIRNGECDMALAGAVNLILSPEVTIAFSKANMLSPEGRCKSFDEAADGYVRGEGCGILVVKRLSDAQRDGDRILAILRGTAANQDGRTNGITAPSGPAQQEVIRTALKRSGIGPEQVGYLEAHGTATPLGDPIEVNALRQVFPERGPEAIPCYFGSVKTNIGHTETVSGIAGVIKVALMMQHQELYPQLHFRSLNHRIDLEGSALCPSQERRSWPDIEGRRIAGVSSFGFGGTNVHVVLEETSAPTAKTTSTPAPERPLHLLTVTARSESALKELAQRYRDSVRFLDSKLAADFCYTANTGRTPFVHRLALTGRNGEELGQQLDAWLSGQKIAGVVQGAVNQAAPKVAFLFTGQGAQYAGMGRKLYETCPSFRATLDRCDAILRPTLGESLLAILHARATDGRLNQTAFTQPALFAVEYALAELWRSWGVEPAAVLGHSVGEYVAACVAGCLSLEDGLHLIAERARRMNALPPGGVMAAVFAPEAKVQPLVQAYADKVAIAAVNGPESVVLSGEGETVRRLLEILKERGISAQMLKVSHAFHSPLMDPMLDAFERFAACIDFQAPHIPLVSNLTGKLLDTAQGLSAVYWKQHVRAAVRFHDGMQTLAALGCEVFLEVGPTPQLCNMGRRCLTDRERTWVPSLRQGADDWQQLLQALATLYVAGAPINWQGFDASYTRSRMSLPTYPFQRQRYWIETAPAATKPASQPSRPTPEARSTGAASTGHPLLGTRLRSALAATQFERELSLQEVPWLADHRIQKAIVMPGAGYLEMGLAALHEMGMENAVLENVVFQEVLLLPKESARVVQVVLTPEVAGKRTFQVFSGNGKGKWTMHVHGQVGHGETPVERPPVLETIRGRCSHGPNSAAFYAELAEHGLNYGPAFRSVIQLWSGMGEALGRLEAPAGIVDELDRCHLHPVLLDGAFHVVAAALRSSSALADEMYLPVGVQSLRLYRPAARELWAFAELSNSDLQAAGETLSGDVTLMDAEGQRIAEVKGLRLRRMGPARKEAKMSDPLQAAADWLYEVEWHEAPLAESATASAKAGNVVIFADRGGVGEELARRLQERGRAPLLIFAGDMFQDNGPARFTVNVEHPERIEKLLEKAFGAATAGSCDAVIHLWSLDAEPQGSSFAESLDRAIPLTCTSITRAVQNLTAMRGRRRLYLVTRGARAVGNECPTALLQSTVVGLGQTLIQEHPELSCTLVDLPAHADPGAEAADLMQEVVDGDAEDQIAYRENRRWVPRLVRMAADTLNAGKGADAVGLLRAGKAARLEVSRSATLDGLRFVPVERVQPAVGQVEIEVVATGLNFSDVLKAMHLYPGITDAVVPLGIECAGRVVAVGAGVTRFAVGDEVMALAPYCFARHALAPEHGVLPRPAGMSFQQAATLPVAYATAYYALHHLAHLASGESVLIHAAAGGVGQAAIQIAQQAGAIVFATAGTPEKRAYLKSLGVEHVFDSRSGNFAEEIVKATAGRGVDVVLNSLAGEAIPRSLALLAPCGRFLELGKTDIYMNRMIGLEPFQNNLSYFAIDMDRLYRHRPATIAQVLAELHARFAAGEYKPLPLTAFPAEKVADAFRYMQQRKNIGKVVVEMAAQTQQPSAASVAIRPDATYLVTGGLGNLGLALTEWLAAQGARHVVLTGRHAPGTEAKAALDRLRQRGIDIEVARCDVASPEEVSALVRHIRTELPPLKGIFHLAGVLQDGLAIHLDRASFEATLGPKVLGAWNLHQATQEENLDLFVLFSSVASLLGSIGQGNYAAGNAFLDVLARSRRANGQPALSVSWGMWNLGMATTEVRRKVLAERGFLGLDPERALQVLGRLLPLPQAHLGVMANEWKKTLQPFIERNKVPSIVLGFVESSASSVTTSTEAVQDVGGRLKDLPAEQRQAFLTEELAQRLAQVTSLPVADINRNTPLGNLGLDSLMLLELKRRIEQSLGVSIPTSRLFENPSLTQLAGCVLELLADQDKTAKTVA